MSFKILYNQLIGGKHYNAGDTLEFPSGTDRNFIERLKVIGAIAEQKAEVKAESKPAPKGKKDDK